MFDIKQLEDALPTAKGTPLWKVLENGDYEIEMNDPFGRYVLVRVMSGRLEVFLASGRPPTFPITKFAQRANITLVTKMGVVTCRPHVLLSNNTWRAILYEQLSFCRAASLWAKTCPSCNSANIHIYPARNQVKMYRGHCLECNTSSWSI